MHVPPEVADLPVHFVYDDQWFSQGYGLDLARGLVIAFHVDRKDQYDSTKEIAIEDFLAREMPNPKERAAQVWVKKAWAAHRAEGEAE